MHREKPTAEGELEDRAVVDADPPAAEGLPPHAAGRIKRADTAMAAPRARAAGRHDAGDQ